MEATIHKAAPYDILRECRIGRAEITLSQTAAKYKPFKVIIDYHDHHSSHAAKTQQTVKFEAQNFKMAERVYNNLAKLEMKKLGRKNATKGGK